MHRCKNIKVYMGCKRHDLQVLADASTDIIMLNLDEGQSGEVDYKEVGGLPNTKRDKAQVQLVI